VTEERLAELELAQRRSSEPESAFRSGVFGSTNDEPKLHFLGWADEVDADALFASGTAYGIRVRRLRR
jgi:hypothetical protein